MGSSDSIVFEGCYLLADGFVGKLNFIYSYAYDVLIQDTNNHSTRSISVSKDRDEVKFIPLIPEMLEIEGFVKDEISAKENVEYYISLDQRLGLYHNKDGSWNFHLDDEDFDTVANMKFNYINEFQALCAMTKYPFPLRFGTIRCVYDTLHN